MEISRKSLNDFVCKKIKEEVCTAFKKVDRELFVPIEFSHDAYLDKPIPLDVNSTISQPSLVAEMIDSLGLKGDEKILEIGTGSGFNAAILSYLSKEVYSIEINKKLANLARKRLKDLGYTNIKVFNGDGKKGIPEKAPFDVVIFTAAIDKIPEAILKQLKEGGKIIYPLEVKVKDYQELVLGIKKEAKILERKTIPVNFVSLI